MENSYQTYKFKIYLSDNNLLLIHYCKRKFLFLSSY